MRHLPGFHRERRITPPYLPAQGAVEKPVDVVTVLVLQDLLQALLTEVVCAGQDQDGGREQLQTHGARKRLSQGFHGGGSPHEEDPFLTAARAAPLRWHQTSRTSLSLS